MAVLSLQTGLGDQLPPRMNVRTHILTEKNRSLIAQKHNNDLVEERPYAFEITNWFLISLNITQAHYKLFKYIINIGSSDVSVF